MSSSTASTTVFTCRATLKQAGAEVLYEELSIAHTIDPQLIGQLRPRLQTAIAPGDALV